MLPAPLVIDTPVPAVNVAADGSAPVLPIASWPEVNAKLVIALEDPPINTLWLVTVVVENVPALSYLIIPVPEIFAALFVAISTSWPIKA